MKPHVVIVYESMWGNTKQIARAIADGLGDAMDVSPVDVSHAPSAVGPEVSLVVAGGPTHAFSMTRTGTRADAVRQGAPGLGGVNIGLREWISSLPTPPDGQRFVTFDTRANRVRHLPGSAAKSAARLAHKRGYPRPIPSESFYVGDVAGPLLDREIGRAAHWGRELAARFLIALPVPCGARSGGCREVMTAHDSPPVAADGRPCGLATRRSQHCS